MPVNMDSSRYDEPAHLQTEPYRNVETVGVLLGLKDIASTARYLGASRPLDALVISRTHEI